MRCPYRFAFTLLLLQNAFAQDNNDEPEEDSDNSLESSLNDITSAFNTAGIVPSLIPQFRPSAKLEIQYTMAGEPFTLEDGETVPAALTENEPKFTITANGTGTNSRPTGSFIALLVDPKGTPKDEDSEDPVQVLHYLKHDLTQTATFMNGNSQPLAPYQRLAPVGEELHQYVVLIYPQPSDFGEKASEVINSDFDRSSFNLTGFTRQFNLSSPVAGNFFLVRPDGNVKPSSSSSTSTVSRPSLTNVPSLTPLFGAANHLKASLGSAVALSMAVVAILAL